jgi:hypothetical protein
MDAPARGALMLVRFIALSLMGWTLVELGLYWVISSSHHTPLKIFPCLLKSIPLVLGVVMLVRAKPLAQWLSDKLE